MGRWSRSSRRSSSRRRSACSGGIAVCVQVQVGPPAAAPFAVAAKDSALPEGQRAWGVGQSALERSGALHQCKGLGPPQE